MKYEVNRSGARRRRNQENESRVAAPQKLKFAKWGRNFMVIHCHYLALHQAVLFRQAVSGFEPRQRRCSSPAEGEGHPRRISFVTMLVIYEELRQEDGDKKGGSRHSKSQHAIYCQRDGSSTDTKTRTRILFIGGLLGQEHTAGNSRRWRNKAR